jgi:hypothetical protein
MTKILKNLVARIATALPCVTERGKESRKAQRIAECRYNKNIVVNFLNPCNGDCSTCTRGRRTISCWNPPPVPPPRFVCVKIRSPKLDENGRPLRTYTVTLNNEIPCSNCCCNCDYRQQATG